MGEVLGKQYTQIISFKSDVYVRNTKTQENTHCSRSAKSVKRLRIVLKIWTEEEESLLKMAINER